MTPFIQSLSLTQVLRCPQLQALFEADRLSCAQLRFLRFANKSQLRSTNLSSLYAKIIVTVNHEDRS